MSGRMRVGRETGLRSHPKTDLKPGLGAEPVAGSEFGLGAEPVAGSEFGLGTEPEAGSESGLRAEPMAASGSAPEAVANAAAESACQLDDVDRRLLTILQRGMPLVSRPYLEIAREMGDVTEQEVLGRIAILKETGVIRRLSGFFDSGRLGYVSALCAARVRPENLEKAATLVNGYEGVTHNYVREHEYNMWFTLIARSVGEREWILDEIESGPWVEQVLRFYTRTRYKINVTFDLEGRPAEEANNAGGARRR